MKRMRCPSASSFGQALRASVWLTIATLGAVAWSQPEKARPLTTGRLSASKYPGVTTRYTAIGAASGDVKGWASTAKGRPRPERSVLAPAFTTPRRACRRCRAESMKAKR